jgi:hypothetical protein
LEEIVAAPVKKTENTTGGIRCADHATPSIRKSWHYFAKKRRSLGRHSLLADQSHGVFIGENGNRGYEQTDDCKREGFLTETKEDNFGSGGEGM